MTASQLSPTCLQVCSPADGSCPFRGKIKRSIFSSRVLENGKSPQFLPVAPSLLHPSSSPETNTHDNIAKHPTRITKEGSAFLCLLTRPRCRGRRRSEVREQHHRDPMFCSCPLTHSRRGENHPGSGPTGRALATSGSDTTCKDKPDRGNCT